MLKSFILGFLTSVVWTYDTFENNSTIDHSVTKYLKKSCMFDHVPHFSFKYFLKNPLVSKFLTIVVWTYDTIGNNFTIIRGASTFLKKVLQLGLCSTFLHQIFPENHLVSKFLTSVVWTYETFENNFVINQKITEYLKWNFGLGPAPHFSFKIFLKNNLLTKI